MIGLNFQGIYKNKFITFFFSFWLKSLLIQSSPVSFLKLMISKYNLYFTKNGSEYRTVPAGIYRTGPQTGTVILVFCTDLTGCVPVIPANIGVFRLKKGNRPVRKKKKTVKTKIGAEVDTR